jgi:uncharacterized membrane protein YkvA (DUF1232 family)
MTDTQLVLYEPKQLAVIERVLRRRLWSRLWARAASLPFAQDVIAAYFCASDRRTPLAVKLTLLGALSGFLLPQRLVPKLLRSLVLGGDVAMLLGALQSFATHIQPEHRLRARLVLIRWRQER